MRIVLVADTFPPLRTSGAVQLRFAVVLHDTDSRFLHLHFEDHDAVEAFLSGLIDQIGGVSGPQVGKTGNQSFGIG